MDKMDEMMIEAISGTLASIADVFEKQGDKPIRCSEVATLLRESYDEQGIKDAVARHREMKA